MIPVALSSAERECLASIADLLIPNDNVMPSASEADVHGSGIDKVFSVRPDLSVSVRAALAALADNPPSSYSELDENRPPHFGGLAEAVTAAYYLNPSVQALVGYARRSEIPIVFDEDLASLTAAVSARGRIYRPTPEPPMQPGTAALSAGRALKPVDR